MELGRVNGLVEVERTNVAAAVVVVAVVVGR
jgi:hypothetical protein